MGVLVLGAATMLAVCFTFCSACTQRAYSQQYLASAVRSAVQSVPIWSNSSVMRSHSSRAAPVTCGGGAGRPRVGVGVFVRFRLVFMLVYSAAVESNPLTRSTRAALLRSVQCRQ